MQNFVSLIGHMATDPRELRYTLNGHAVTGFRIALDRRKRNGEKGETDFVDVVLWRQHAEFAANYAEKGRLVHVQGELRTRSYVDPKTQQTVRVVEIEADEFKVLDRPRMQGQGVPDGGEPAPLPTEEGTAAPRPEEDASTAAEPPASAEPDDPTTAFAG